MTKDWPYGKRDMMPKLKNKVVAVGLSALLSICCFPTLALANGDSDVSMLVSDGYQPYSGIEYLISEDGNGDTLTIHPMDNASDGYLDTQESAAPWTSSPLSSQIKYVYIAGNLTGGSTLAGLFKDCTSLVSVTGLGYINTGNTMSMESMFQGCSNLESVDLGNWDTSNVQSMSNMFSGCTSLTTLDISGFNTSAATYSESVFSEQLASITIGSGFTLNSQVSGGPWVDSGGNTYQSFTDVPSGSAGTFTKVQAPTGVTLNEESKSLAPQETFQLTANLLPSGAQSTQIEWTTSNSEVATVSTDGLVTAVSAGQATITVTVNGSLTAACLISVSSTGPNNPDNPDNPDDPSNPVTINETQLTLTGNESKTLTATTQPADATVVWSTDAPTVAAVNAETGEVSAVSKGTATITATTSAGSATCAVTVLNPAKSVTVSMPSTIKVDTELSLNAYLAGDLEGDVDPIESVEYEWLVTPATIATVTKGAGATASIKANAVGEATLSVSATAEGMTIAPAVEKFLVTQEEVEVTVSVTPTATSIAEGETATLSATVQPSELQSDLEWTSKDQTIATVTNQGVVTGVKAGRTEIVASVGQKTATCTVTVTAPGEEPPTVTSIAFKSSAVTLTGKATQALEVTIEPSTITVSNLVWASSNEGVATVDNKGAVTAVSKGTADITATSPDGKVTATCAVTVLNPPASIEADVPSVLKIGETADVETTLGAGALPGATDAIESYVWESANPSVASVTAKADASTATVEALTLGSTEISVKATVGSATLESKMPLQVSAVAVESITLSETEKSVAIGSEPFTLTATVLPETETPFAVTWETSDASIATVDSNGTVTPNAIGQAVITAKAGDKAAICAVTVTPLTVTTAPDSTIPGTLTVRDPETAKALAGKSLSISESSPNDINKIMSAFETSTNGKTVFLNAYDISLVEADGTEFPWNDPNSTVEVNIAVSESVMSMAKTNTIGVFYINDDATLVEPMKTTLGDYELTFETSHFSTYALGATPLSDGQQNGNNQGGDATQVDSGDKGNAGDNLKGLASTGDLLLSTPAFLCALAALGIVLGIVVIVQSCNAGKRRKRSMRRY